MTIGSVDGLISGMSTSSIIDQIISLEARGQTALKSRITLQNRVISALQTVNSKMVGLGTAAAALTAKGTFQTMKATSSATSVSASAAAGALGGSLTFDVTKLAAAEIRASTTTHALTDTVVTSGKVTVTKGGTSVDVSIADGSLKGVVDAINASPESGVRAAAVQVSPGQYRLQLTSSTTGTAGSFTASGMAITDSVVSAAADATIYVGQAGTGYNVTSPTNTFTDVLPGVTFTVTRPETAVTVDVKSDTAGISGKVEAMVKALNGALEEIAFQSAINPTDRTKSGPLAGDSQMRALTQEILSSVTKALPVGGSLADVGIQTTKEGRVSFDSAKFTAAFAANPAKVEAMFGRQASFVAGASSSLSLTAVGARTLEGDHDVVITQAATKATASYSSMVVLAGQAYSVTQNGKTASYTAQVGDGVAQVAAGLRTAAATAGVAMTISDGPNQIDMEATTYGAASSLSVAGATGSTVAVLAGQDVKGTIGGIVASGAGQTLSTVGKSGAASDISLEVRATASEISAAGGTLAAGKVHVQSGFAQRLETLSKGISDRFDGSITKTIESKQSAIKGYNDQVAAWDVRLTIKRNSIRRQFAAMEAALGKMKDQSSWLAGQIASLPTGG